MVRRHTTPHMTVRLKIRKIRRVTNEIIKVERLVKRLKESLSKESPLAPELNETQKLIGLKLLEINEYNEKKIEDLITFESPETLDPELLALDPDSKCPFKEYC